MAAASLPPGPRLPRYLQTALLILRPDATLRRWQARYGNVFTVRSALSGRLVLVADPRRRRGLLPPPFHGDRMRAYEAIMRQAADRDIDSWPVGRSFALLPHMQSITLDVIVRAVFGVKDAARADELKARMRWMPEPTTSPVRVRAIAIPGGVLGRQGADRRFTARIRAVDELLYDVIARRRAEPDLAEREDICSMLLTARDESGEPMTDREVRDELMTLLVAGHETTATSLAWAFERLLRHPPALERLTDEARAGSETAYADA